MTSFYYFAYGSNLLKARISLQNPTATFIGAGKLEDYQLSFRKKSEKYRNSWLGATATIVSSPGEHMYGAVWELDKTDLASLDRQEGVPNTYNPITVQIQLVDENLKTIREIPCRSYQILHTVKGAPSPYYLDVILRGARDSGLPEHYQQRLRDIPHNGCKESCQLYNDVLARMSEEERASTIVDFS